MQLCGKSLEQLFQQCACKFSLKVSTFFLFFVCVFIGCMLVYFRCVLCASGCCSAQTGCVSASVLASGCEASAL
jgi:hypothetical protein